MNTPVITYLVKLNPVLRTSRLVVGCAVINSKFRRPRSEHFEGCEHPKGFAYGYRHSGTVSSEPDRHLPFTEKNSKLRSDPEIQAWNDQISQQLGLTNESSSKTENDTFSQRTSAGVKADCVQTIEGLVPDVEIEDFGDYSEEEAEFQDTADGIHVPISLDRGKNGVFDVEEIVSVLEDQNGVDVRVISVPPEARFVDHMVIVSGKSLRHMRAMASTIHWLYNRKKRPADRPFRLEGKDCNDWLAMDLGNVAVHIFTDKARLHYDLETLWTLGPEHDDQRHYVHDDHVNLTAAELFWLETHMNKSVGVQGDEDQLTEDSALQLAKSGADSSEFPIRDSSCVESGRSDVQQNEGLNRLSKKPETQERA